MSPPINDRITYPPALRRLFSIFRGITVVAKLAKSFGVAAIPKVLATSATQITHGCFAFSWQRKSKYRSINYCRSGTRQEFRRPGNSESPASADFQLATYATGKSDTYFQSSAKHSSSNRLLRFRHDYLDSGLLHGPRFGSQGLRDRYSD